MFMSLTSTTIGYRKLAKAQSEHSKILHSFSPSIKRGGRDGSERVYFFQLPLRVDIQWLKTDSLVFFDFYKTFLIKKHLTFNIH